MSNGEPRPDKICLCCGERIVSKHYTDNRKVWAARKYCSVTCRTDHYGGRPAKRLPAFAPIDNANVIATRKLLKRLLAYGLHNDGLPGLPASDLLRLAKEHGVAA